MPTDGRLEEQINQFYENGPDVQDALPMKDYLLKHENNQMAWYLLGKQYLARGQEAKANYCFAQAGPVYEAFESKKGPVIGEEETAGGGAGVQASSRRRGKAAWLTAAFAAAALLLGLLAYGERAAAPELAAAVGKADAGTAQGAGDVGVAPGSTPDRQDGGGAAGAGRPTASPAGGGQDGSGKPQAAGGLMAAVAGNDAAGQAVLGGLLTARGQTAPSLLLMAPRLGKWTDWTRSGKPLAQVAPAAGQAGASVAWYDAGWCPCGTAQDASQARERVAAWKPLQEAKLVLASAMLSYKQRTGKWPASPEALAAAYPNNVMSGWREELTAWFDELSQAQGSGKTTAQAGAWPGWPDAAGAAAGRGKPAGLLAPMTAQPLEIVVDTTRNRLAVVSGGVLLRNYEVGLGAKDTPTPLGSFVISEKVRDPNGSSTGAFGSRGMTLSDTLYAIHGTDEPSSVGKDESHGCIRMSKEDVEELFDLVPLGTKVTIGKGGLPLELRAPEQRFRLKPSQNETNPGKKYEWLN